MHPQTPLHLALQVLGLAAHTTAARLTQRLSRRVRDVWAGRDVGLSTLEIVVIALGLFLLATALVAALTAAVNSRIAQIN